MIRAASFEARRWQESDYGSDEDSDDHSSLVSACSDCWCWVRPARRTCAAGSVPGPTPVRNVPQSIRDNPGAYRSLYTGSPRYFGGK